MPVTIIGRGIAMSICIMVILFYTSKKYDWLNCKPFKYLKKFFLVLEKIVFERFLNKVNSSQVVFENSHFNFSDKFKEKF